MGDPAGEHADANEAPGADFHRGLLRITHQSIKKVTEDLGGGHSTRQCLKLMGSPTTLAGIRGCPRKPEVKTALARAKSTLVKLLAPFAHSP